MKTKINSIKESAMNNTLIKSSLVLLLLAVMVAQVSVAGRGDKAGSSAAPMLLIPVGGRDIAMGGSTVANSFGIEAVHYNPAGVAWSTKQSEAIFSHMNYIADIGVDY
ncbi:MAG TPA: hypothetical protein DCQ28_15295, partial [Bacteroidetes bacterium]|nr:hypothetical protein [Bacteroidota bacterium]